MINKLSFYFAVLLATLLAVGGTSSVFAEEDFDDFGFEEEEELPIETQWQMDFVRSGFFELIYVPDDNFKYGQYNGLNDKGLRFSGEIDLIKRPGRGDTEDTSFWTLRGDNIGLKTGKLEFMIGRQGNYSFTVAFDNFVSTGNNTGTTPFRGQGSDFLYLPGGWAAGPNTGDMSLALDPISVNQEIERNQLLLEFAKQIADDWAITARYDFERKSGEKIMGAAFYFDAANPHSALLPVPVDYDNHEFNVNLDYTSTKLQLQLSLLSSSLDNRFDEVTWFNPYAGAFTSEVDYPFGSGSIDLPSDTNVQQLRLNANYRFSAKARLRVDVSQSRSEVDDDLSPYTVNPYLKLTQDLPITRIEDSLDTKYFYASLLTNPWKRISINAKYRFEARENNIPVLPWNYVRGDGADQFSVFKSIYNQAHKTEKDQYTLESTLRMSSGGRLTLAYDFNNVWRTFASVDETEEDIYRIEYKTRLFDKLSARFEYAYSDLNASSYNWSQSYFNTYTVDQINLIPDNQRFNNHPLLRQYHLASHEDQALKANFNLPLNAAWHLSLGIDYASKDYDQTILGLKAVDQFQASYSASYTPSNYLSAYISFSYAYNEMEQSGRAFRGGIEKPAGEIYPPFPQGSDPKRNWDLLEEGINQSLAAGFEWSPIPNKYDISAEYSYVDSSIEDRFKVYGALDLVGKQLPDITSGMHYLKFTGSRHYSSKLTVRLNYEYYRFSSEDWAFDGLTESTMDKVLSLGLATPNEVINVISLSAMYKF